MSEPIGVGDWVECVDASPCGGYPPTGLISGKIYQVEKTLFAVDGEPILRLVGFPHEKHPNHGGWLASRFKPIYRPSESLFLTRLMDVPADPEKVMA